MQLDTSRSLRQAVASEYNSLGYYQLFANDGAGAEITLLRAWELDSANPFVPTNLPWAYLLRGEIDQARNFFREWEDKPYNQNNRPIYRDAFLSDLERLKSAGVPGIDYELVRQWLEVAADEDK